MSHVRAADVVVVAGVACVTSHEYGVFVGIG